jgi:uncharacterized protein (DUF305 family)
MRSIPARVTVAVVAVVVAVAAILLAGCNRSAEPAEGGYVGPNVPEAPVITGEPASHNADDVSFATDMISHHNQAIELLRLVPERSTNPKLAALASQISAVQQPEINIMNVLLVQWNENPDLGDESADGDETGGGDSPTGQGPATPGVIDGATMAKLESLRGPQFDTLWLKSMIRQQQRAVEVAAAEIADGANVDARVLAESMVATQEADIEQLKQILKGSKP